MATLTAISFTVALGFGIVAPSIPSFARHFGVSNAAAATVISAFALMRVVGALPAGRLTDRFGEHWVMAAGIAIVAVSSILAGFSVSFTQLIVLRGIGGLGSAMFSISARTLLLVSVPRAHRGRASGLFSGGFLVGGITGPAIGGLVAAWSLRAPFFIYGGMLLVPALIAAAILRNAPRRAVPDDPRAARPFAEMARTLRSRAYLAASSANLADGFAVIGVRSAIVPLFVRDVLHRSAVWTGVGFGVVAVLNAAALLPSGRAADSHGRRPVIIGGCLVSAAGLVMLALLPGIWGYLAALAVFGLGSGLLDVAPSAMIGDILGGPGTGGTGARTGGGTDGTSGAGGGQAAAQAGQAAGQEPRRMPGQAAGQWSRPSRWPVTSAQSPGRWQPVSSWTRRPTGQRSGWPPPCSCWPRFSASARQKPDGRIAALALTGKPVAASNEMTSSEDVGTGGARRGGQQRGGQTAPAARQPCAGLPGHRARFRQVGHSGHNQGDERRLRNESWRHAPDRTAAHRGTGDRGGAGTSAGRGRGRLPAASH